MTKKLFFTTIFILLSAIPQTVVCMKKESLLPKKMLEEVPYEVWICIISFLDSNTRDTKLWHSSKELRKLTDKYIEIWDRQNKIIHSDQLKPKQNTSPSFYNFFYNFFKKNETKASTKIKKLIENLNEEKRNIILVMKNQPYEKLMQILLLDPEYKINPDEEYDNNKHKIKFKLKRLVLIGQNIPSKRGTLLEFPSESAIALLKEILINCFSIKRFECKYNRHTNLQRLLFCPFI